MKQISARQFRTTFPLLTEPVMVVQRRDGFLVDLGAWYPKTAPTADETKRLDRVVAGFTPVPKPKPRQKT